MRKEKDSRAETANLRNGKHDASAPDFLVAAGTLEDRPTYAERAENTRAKEKSRTHPRYKIFRPDTRLSAPQPFQPARRIEQLDNVELLDSFRLSLTILVVIMRDRQTLSQHIRRAGMRFGRPRAPVILFHSPHRPFHCSSRTVVRRAKTAAFSANPWHLPCSDRRRAVACAGADRHRDDELQA